MRYVIGDYKRWLKSVIFFCSKMVWAREGSIRNYSLNNEGVCVIATEWSRISELSSYLCGRGVTGWQNRGVLFVECMCACRCCGHAVYCLLSICARVGAAVLRCTVCWVYVLRSSGVLFVECMCACRCCGLAVHCLLSLCARVGAAVLWCTVCWVYVRVKVLRSCGALFVKCMCTCRCWGLVEYCLLSVCARVGAADLWCTVSWVYMRVYVLRSCGALFVVYVRV
jgi:hypothetical protein